MKLKHYDNDGSVRFVTFCTHRRLPLLTNDRYRRFVASAINKGREQHGFKLLAYVVMPEHVHLVILPPEGTRLGKVIGKIKRRSAREILGLLRQSGGTTQKKLIVFRGAKKKSAFWQRRCYDHNCRDEASVWEKVNYCHQNPVSRGLVQDAAVWRWSNWRAYQGEWDVPL